jgi:hypothetical protein
MRHRTGAIPRAIAHVDRQFSKLMLALLAVFGGLGTHVAEIGLYRLGALNRARSDALFLIHRPTALGRRAEIAVRL